MVISTILKVFGVVQNHNHFVSQRRRELVQLTTEYEVMLWETKTLLLSAQLNVNAHLDLVSQETMDLRSAIETELNLVNECLAQIEDQRELPFSVRSNALSLDQWDELISRRHIQRGTAEFALNKWEKVTAKLNLILTKLGDDYNFFLETLDHLISNWLP